MVALHLATEARPLSFGLPRSFAEGVVLVGEAVVRLRLLRLVILVEALQLVDERLGHSVQGSHLVRCDRHFDVFHVLYYRVELLVLDSVEGLHHVQVILFFLIFLDNLLDRVKVLLVRQVDVVQQRTLSWKEGAGHL